MRCAEVAQSVEQRPEKPRVGGSIPPLGTTHLKDSLLSPVVSVFPCPFIRRMTPPSPLFHGGPGPTLNFSAQKKVNPITTGT